MLGVTYGTLFIQKKVLSLVRRKGYEIRESFSRWRGIVTNEGIRCLVNSWNNILEFSCVEENLKR